MAGPDNKGRPVIGPTEFAILVKVFTMVTAEPWFTTDEHQKNAFRRYIIKAFRAGYTDAFALTAHCREIGRRYFSTLETN